MTFRDEEGRFHHIKVYEGELPNRMLLPGSRSRVKRIAERLDDPRILADDRQLVVEGYYKGVRIGAVDTGMGPSSAAIIVREVIEAIDYGEGEAYLIRPGTSGSLQPYVKVGDLVVSTAVVADEDVSWRIVGPRFPLVSDPNVVSALVSAAEEAGYKLGDDLHVGVTHVKSALYEFEEPEVSAFPERARSRLEQLTCMGVLCTEMELSVILALASWYNALSKEKVVKAGGIFLVLSPYGGGEFRAPPEDDLIDISLEALASL